MTAPTMRSTEHSITVAAPARQVYDIVAHAADWPHHFTPTLHVEILESGGGEERLRIWATANGEVKCWTSHRVLDSAALSVRFRQEVSAPPVAFMSGEWRMTPLDTQTTRVTLLHEYGAVDDEPQSLRWIDRAVDTNSAEELARLGQAAELAGLTDELLLSFEDSVEIAAPPPAVYGFLRSAGEWPRRIPHVDRLELTEQADVQHMDMDTRTADGSVHTTTSVRICLPPDRIVYKQVVTPALMTAHTGSWRVTARGKGTLATSRHTVLLAPDRVGEVLGPDATLATARDFVRKALGRNSTVTLEHAKAYAEALAAGTGEGSCA
ncbi:aromatase/cyclase [Streptomyces sp. NBC_01092]|uniref:aromatase/cyclase n=1 Tax=Streptomyces sp. NBC_01092 TaxID=2903748 RepID=UPI00386C2D9E|nr:aromatase/cyclase [Streptomyces sp. NBC_01092]